MNKKNYQKPAMQVVTIQGQQHILAGSVTSVDGGVFNSEVKGGNGSARGRGFDDWDDEDDEE